MQSKILILFVGFLIGIAAEAHHPQMFRSWDDADKTLYRGDKVSLHLPEPHAAYYKGCKAIYLAGQAVDEDNLAWVLLQDCDFQKEFPQYGRLVTDIFSLRYLDRIK